MVALTLNKGMAYDGIRNPVSQRERRGFSFSWIPIRYIRFTNLCAHGKKPQVLTSPNFM